MKTILVCLLMVLTYSYSNAFRKVYLDLCLKQNGLTLGKFNKIESRKGQGGDVPDNFKCTSECILEKYKGFDSKGKFDAESFQEAALATFQVKLRIATINCSLLKGEDDCDTAYLIAECLSQKLAL